MLKECRNRLTWDGVMQIYENLNDMDKKKEDKYDNDWGHWRLRSEQYDHWYMNWKIMIKYFPQTIAGRLLSNLNSDCMHVYMHSVWTS